MSRKKALLLGLGLDGDDGHQRITRGEELLILGGSQETHERMQEHVIRVGEKLESRGKTLSECSADEVRDMLHEAEEEI